MCNNCIRSTHAQRDDFACPPLLFSFIFILRALIHFIFGYWKVLKNMQFHIWLSQKGGNFFFFVFFILLLLLLAPDIFIYLFYGQVGLFTYAFTKSRNFIFSLSFQCHGQNNAEIFFILLSLVHARFLLLSYNNFYNNYLSTVHIL